MRKLKIMKTDQDMYTIIDLNSLTQYGDEFDNMEEADAMMENLKIFLEMERMPY